VAKNLSGEPDTGFTPYSQASSGGADIGFKPYDIPTPAKPTSGDFTTGIKQSGLELAGTAYGLAGLAGAGIGAYNAFKAKKGGPVPKVKSGGIGDLAIYNAMKGGK